ncbi:hypothetical protein [Sphingomonas bacterium]|uniref:hypothetical protein n=1 Tax=Sphingomonas bacterium TaxID=1895847 RepID=UPI0020C6F479|nr:hypothetical protein [Sphingomonas bacterium]
MRFEPLVCVIAAAAIVAPGQAATPRDLLTAAAFQSTDRQQALALVNQAAAQSEALLAAQRNSREGLLQHAMAIGYRAALTKKPGDARESRKMFEALVAANPRDPEFQLAIGGWHLDTIAAGFLAKTVLDARKDVGLDAVNKAVALGGDRAFFKGLAAMMRIRLDPADVDVALALAQQAAAAPAPTPLDRIVKRDAEAMLLPLRAGDGKAAAALARKLLPFGRIR